MTSRKERQAAYNRKMILEAAARVLVHSGYDGVTVEAIAKEADYSPAALYKYFKSKAAIIRSLLAYVMETFMDELQRPGPRPETVRDELIGVLDAAFRFAQERRPLFEALILHGPFIDTDSRDELVEQFFSGDLVFIEYLKSIMERGLAQGELRRGSADELAWAMHGLTQSFLIRWHIRPHAAEAQPPRSDEHHRLVDLFLLGAAGAEPSQGGNTK